MENREEKKVEEKKPERERQTREESSVKSKENLKMFFFGILGAVVLVFCVLLSAVLYKVYAKTDLDGFTRVSSKVLRLPAMKINGETVLYSDYIEDMSAIQKLLDYEKENSGVDPGVTEEEMRDQVLMRLFNSVLVKQAAETYGAKVSQEEVDALKEEFLSQFPDTDTALKEMKARYGWSLDTYERKVLAPYLTSLKLNEKISGDKEAQKEVYDKAMGVLKQIQDGADFAEMAKQYGEDGTASVGGDLGWFGRGVMVSEFEDAVFSLEKGELKDELVTTQYGYHIVKLEDKGIQKITDENGEEVEEEQVNARHILFQFVQGDAVLDKMAQEADIHFYLNVENPFEDASLTS